MVLLSQIMRPRSWGRIGIQIAHDQRLASFLLTKISLVAQSRIGFDWQISDVEITARPLPALGSSKAISGGPVRLAFSKFSGTVNPRE